MQRLAVQCVRPGWFHLSWCGIVGLLGSLMAAQGADLESAREDYQSGRYTNCIATCEKAIANDESAEEWRLLLARSLVAVGRYTNAASVISTNLEQYGWSIHLRLLGRED